MKPNTFLWIGVSDIKEHFDISTNTDAAKVKQPILLAQDTEARNNLPSGMYEALEPLLKANPPQYQANKSYPTGSIVFYVDGYYISTTITTALPTVTADWDEHELLNFWLGWVKPWLCACAYAEFMPMHPFNVTMNGIEKLAQDGFTAITATERSEMILEINRKKGIYESRMNVELKRANNTFDGVQYGNNSPCHLRNRYKTSFSNIAATANGNHRFRQNRTGFGYYD